MPDVKFDFSKVTYSGLLEVLAPIVPGAILGSGVLILRPVTAATLLSNPLLGYRSRLVVAIFLCYVAGLLLNLLVNYDSYLVGYAFGYLLKDKITLPAPSKNLLWRRMARDFLGPQFAPTTDDLYFSELHKQKQAEVDQIADPQQRAAQQELVKNFFEPKQLAELEWNWWYEVLSKYFAKPQTWALPWQYFLSMVHCSSWAVLWLMVLTHRHHWLAWLLCINGIFVGNFAAWFAGGIFSDPYAVSQTALLLQAARTDGAQSPREAPAPSQ